MAGHPKMACGVAHRQHYLQLEHGARIDLLLQLIAGVSPSATLLALEWEARVNPELSLDLKTRGDRLGGHVGVYGGYAFLADGGLSFRALAGTILFDDEGLAAAANVRFSVGWAF